MNQVQFRGTIPFFGVNDGEMGRDQHSGNVDQLLTAAESAEATTIHMSRDDRRLGKLGF